MRILRPARITLLAFLAAAQPLFAQSPQPPTTRPAEAVEFIEPEPIGEINQFRSAQKEGAPALRGFVAPILGDASKPWSVEPAADLSPQWRAAADIVSRGLARDGLIVTLARVVEFMGWRWVSHGGEQTVEDLRAIGFPVDLLRFFPNEGIDPPEPFQVIVDVTRMLGSDTPVDAIAADLRARPFKFVPTAPGFRAASDSGSTSPALVRMQLSTGSYFQGPGDGGNIDILRQLLDLWPDVPFLVSIERRSLQPFRATLATWKLRRAAPLKVLIEPWPISQWAQDNAKVGKAPADPHAAPILLVPRYASRREEISSFVPGDTWLVDALSAAGLDVRHSPLLFQGGNLITVEEASGRRTLLLGESEIYRNMALGLTREQVEAAFTAEMGVDQCLVLPAVSYHIDYEVSVRAEPDGVTAFVNDSAGATRAILQACLGKLLDLGELPKAECEKSLAALQNGNADAAVDAIESVLNRHSLSQGRLSLAFATRLQQGNADSGVGSLQRLLWAMDTAAFAQSPPRWRGPDAASEAYARSLRQREPDRAALRNILAHQGWKCTPIPSTADGDRSINHLNGLQLKDAYLMPSYGGIYSDLDLAAGAAFQAALPKGVRVLPIHTGESQRRDGALRCSASLLP